VKPARWQQLASPDVIQVTHCTPSLGVRGDTLDVTVHGASFVATPAVSFGAGLSVHTVTFVSATELTVNVSIRPRPHGRGKHRLKVLKYGVVKLQSALGRMSRGNIGKSVYSKAYC